MYYSMRYFQFLFHLVLYINFMKCELVNENREKNNFLNAAEVHFAHLFEGERMKLKEEHELRLSEEILPIEILNESTSLYRYEAFNMFKWESEYFIIASAHNETCVFLVTFSNNDAFLREFFKVEHLNFVQHVDYLKSFIIDDILWIFETSKHGNMIQIIRIKLMVGKSERLFQQVIPVSYPVTGIHPYKYRNGINLIVTSQKNNESDEIIFFSEENGIFIQKYNESYIHESEVYLSTFAHGKYVYIALTEEKVVVVKRFEPESGMEEIWSSSSTTKVKSFLSFEDELSHNLFLVLISEESLDFFLFRDEKLLPWDKIKIHTENRIGHVFSHKFRNFLILTNKTMVSLYTQNESGDFTLKLSFNSNCNVLKDVQALMDDEKILFIAYCSGGQERFHFHHLFMMNDNELQNDSPMEDLKIEKCLNELGHKIKRNALLIPYFINTVNKKSLESIDLTQAGSSIDGGSVSRTRYTPPQKFVTLRSNVDKLIKITDSFKNKTKTFEDKVPNLLTYEGDQHIYTTVNTRKMIANNSVIIEIDLEKFNDLSLDDYRTKFMTLQGDQFVNTDLNFDKIITKNVNAKSLSTEGFVLLPENLLDSKNSSQIVTGTHLFSSLEVKEDIVGSSSSDSNEINGININDIVKKFNDVWFKGQQVFRRTMESEDHLNIKYINGVDYDAWSRSVMKSSKDVSVPFGGSIEVEGNVRVNGNVKALAINGIDFNSLFGNMARKSNAVQEFSDKIVFKNGLKVDNLETSRVNDLDWNHYLRMKDEQVKASFNIDDGAITKDLMSGSINGLNFGEDVLISGSDQIVKGRITFVSDVEVTASAGVTMEMGATINAIDPSLHAQIGQLSNTEVFDKKLNLLDVLTINGDVRVTILNNVTFPDFKVGYWKKSEQQRIPNTFEIERAEFKKSLYASTLNGINVANYLRTDVPQTLSARNFFLNDVLVHGDIYIENNRTINKVDVSALKDSSISLHGAQIINGHSEFTKALRVNNFFTKDGFLNGINLEKELFTTSLRFPNSLVFTSPVKANSLQVKNLRVGKLNGKETLERIFYHGSPVSEIKGNLFADRVSVNEITFTKNLNGRNFNEWIASVVRTDKSSHIFSEKFTVRGDVSFTGSLDVDVLNSKHLLTFIKKLNRNCDECEVRGRKVFLKPVEVAGDLFAEYINGVGLHELKERLLSKTKEQTIKGIYKFNGGLTCVTIEVPKISEIPVDDIVLTNNVSFNLPVKFKNNVVFDELYSKDGWIDGCKLQEVFNPPLTNIQSLLSNISLGHLEITGDMTVEGRIALRSSNEDLLAYIRNLVRKTNDQRIYGVTHFQNEASVQSLKTNYVNKYHSQDFLQKYFTTQRDVQTSCNIEVEHLEANEIIAADVSAEVINDVKLKLIADFGVKKSSSEIISGRKTFPNAFINANLKIQKINGVDLENLVKLDGNNSELKLVFKKPISFMKNIWVYGLIAQENPQSLFKHFESILHSRSSPFPLKYEQLIIEGDLIVNSMNNLSLDDLFLKTSKYPVVSGRKNFIGGIIIDGDSKIAVINGLNPNQFLQSPSVFSKGLLERLFEQRKSDNSLINTEVALGNEAFAIMRINEANLEKAKGLYRALFSITEADRISLSGDRIHSLRMSRTTVAHVFAEYEACLSRNLCPCFDTYTINIKNGKLKLEEVSFKGKNFPVLFRQNRKLYNFNVRCYNQDILTSIAKVHNTEEGVVVTTETKYFNHVLQVLFFSSNDQDYFLLHTESKDDDSVSLNVVNKNLETIWNEIFKAKVSKLVLKQVYNDWYLLIIINEENLSSGSQLYTWNSSKAKFVLVRNFPMAATGDITSFGPEVFLVLGFDSSSKTRCHGEEWGTHLQIYKSVGKSQFYPFTSLPVFGVSSVVFFNVDNELFLAVASRSKNMLAVHKMMHQEGFVKTASFTVINPSELNFINIQDRNYLLLLHDKSVSLLNLNFKGISVSN